MWNNTKHNDYKLNKIETFHSSIFSKWTNNNISKIIEVNVLKFTWMNKNYCDEKGKYITWVKNKYKIISKKKEW